MPFAGARVLLRLLRQLFAVLPQMPVSAWRHRALMRQMVKREIIGRYRGSLLGLLWSFITPVLMLAVYTFVFSVVFRAKWGEQGSGDKLEFALVLFAGLIVFTLFSECLTRAPTLITSNVNYVKKVIFPLDILPWVSLGSALFHALVSFAVLLIAMPFGGFGWQATMLWLPLLLLPFMLLILGLSWFFASLGVFVRDVAPLMTMAMTVLMFLSPIFYPASALPAEVRAWLFLNPVTFVIEQARDLVVWGRAPDFVGLGLYAVVAFFTAWLGYFWFEKTRRGFADVL